MRKLQFPPNSQDDLAGAVRASSPSVSRVFNALGSGIGPGGNSTSTHKFPSATTSYSSERSSPFPDARRTKDARRRREPSFAVFVVVVARLASHRD